MATVAGPGGAPVEHVAIEMTDPHGINGPGVAQLGGRLAPALALLPGDEQESPGLEQVVDGQAIACLVFEPGVPQGLTGPSRRLVDAGRVRSGPRTSRSSACARAGYRAGR